MSRLEIFSCALCPLCLFVFACISCFACLLLLTFICSLACTALPCLGLRLPLHPFVCVPAFSYGGWLDLRMLVFIPPPLSPFILSPFSPLLVLCLLLFSFALQLCWVSWWRPSFWSFLSPALVIYWSPRLLVFLVRVLVVCWWAGMEALMHLPACSSPPKTYLPTCILCDSMPMDCPEYSSRV